MFRKEIKNIVYQYWEVREHRDGFGDWGVISRLGHLRGSLN